MMTGAGAEEWYNHLANIYDELYGEEQRRKLEIIKRFLKKRFNKCLDAGCGTGISTEYLLSICNEIIAIDISENMLRKAKERIKNKKVKFLKMDLKEMNFKEEFDLIFCITVLQDDPQPEKILAKLKEAIKKDGIAIISVLNRGKKDWEELIKRYFKIKEKILEEKDIIFICEP